MPYPSKITAQTAHVAADDWLHGESILHLARILGVHHTSLRDRLYRVLREKYPEHGALPNHIQAWRRRVFS